MIHRLRAALGAGLLSAWTAGGGLLSEEAFPAEDLAFFERSIRPVLAQQCYSCHSHRAESLKASLRLDSRSGFLAGGEGGPVVEPGRPDLSRLIEAIGYENVDLQMPPRSRLDSAVIADFRLWVEKGLPWPEEPEPSGPAKEEEFDIEERRKEHWAWQPVVRPPLPPVHGSPWVSNPIDAFILQGLEDQGLSPAPPASRSTLLRRLSFAVLGLPPSPGEVEEFVEDGHPLAWERRVDAMLASPRMGERWARHWLDLVRYAETLGHEFDYALPNAWRYRDYVIRAFNQDVPYLQWATEHIAGDLVDDPRRDPASGLNESWAGTGFYWLGQQVHSPVDIGMNQLELIDNQIDVLTKTFLGMTVSCARCHDHKFDAISTRDFYSLFGILSSSRYHEADLEPSGERDRLRDRLRQEKQAVREAAGADWQREAQRLDRTMQAALDLLSEPVEGDPGGTLLAGFEEGESPGWGGDELPGTGKGTGSTAADGSGEAKALKGEWRSRTFVVEHPYIHFLVEGGSDAKRTAFELRVDGKAVRSAAGRDRAGFAAHRWEVGEFVGREARLALRDNAEGTWGYIAVDHVLAGSMEQAFGHRNRPMPSPERTLEAARAKDLDGALLSRWTRELDRALSEGARHPLYALAGGELARSPETPAPAVSQPFDDWFATGAALADARTEPGEPVLLDREGGLALAVRPSAHSGRWSRRFQGSLRSPTFRIEERFVHALASGRNVRANLVLNNFNLIRAPIYGGLKRRLDHDEPRWITFDLGSWIGQTAYFEIKDTEPGDLAGGRGSYGADGWFSLHGLVRSSQGAPPSPRPLSGAYLAGLSPQEGDRMAHWAGHTREAVGRWSRGEEMEDGDLRWLAWLAGKELLSAEGGALPEARSRYRQLARSVDPPRLAPAMVEGSGVDAPVLVRGDPRTPGEAAPRGNLEALGTRIPFEGSGRMALARHIADPANPLTARVYVNRVWHHMFGRGIVESTDNFGVLGSRPTHPELLDWLAHWFVNEGEGSTKRLLRLILASSAWRMSSSSPEFEERDPTNRWFHRMNVRRLEGEAIRDAILQVSGRLDLRQFGPPPPIHLTAFMTGRGRPGRSGPVDGEGRRSVYQEVRRNFLSPSMLAFDTPLPFTTFGRRSVSNVPAQALILLNDPLVSEMAEHWARILPEAPAGERVESMYLSALGRPPLLRERQEALAYVGEGGEEAWADLCHVLFNVKEFIYLD